MLTARFSLLGTKQGEAARAAGGTAAGSGETAAAQPEFSDTSSSEEEDEDEGSPEHILCQFEKVRSTAWNRVSARLSCIVCLPSTSILVRAAQVLTLRTPHTSLFRFGSSFLPGHAHKEQVACRFAQRCAARWRQGFCVSENNRRLRVVTAVGNASVLPNLAAARIV